jgi:hypothetical protein
MAHVNERTGTYSELIAKAALVANGWTVHGPETTEAYDILAQDPVSGKFTKIQVKTIRQREDRRGDYVVYARRGNGASYDNSDTDAFIGIWAVDGETPRAYMFENRGISEYWASEARASERWVELSIALNRDLYTESGAV